MTPYQNHAARWRDCRRCELACQRSKIVLLRGSVPCDVLFVGEAPGASEDALGIPFVGPAGQLLDRIVEDAIPKFPPPEPDPRFRWAFTNLVACFPRKAKETDDHQPPPASIQACGERLRELVAVCKPKLLVCVGTLARDWLDPKRRGSIKLDVPRTISIDHPSFILRSVTAAQGLMIKRCVVTIRNAVEQL